MITPSSVHQSWPEENQAEPKIWDSKVQAHFHPKSKKDIQCLTTNRAIALKLVCTGASLTTPLLALPVFMHEMGIIMVSTSLGYSGIEKDDCL